MNIKTHKCILQTKFQKKYSFICKLTCNFACIFKNNF